MVAATAWTLLDFPGPRWALAVLFAGVGVSVARFPRSWVFLVPALLPVLDLAPWSGRIFWDEGDLLLSMLLAGLLVGGQPVRYFRGRALLVTVAFGALALVAAGLGVLPWEGPASSGLLPYLSPWNALRVAKGFAWAFAFLPFIPQGGGIGLFSAGWVAGLAGVSSAALWERHAFVGLLDLSRDFRVTSTFSTMHIGGGHVEAFLCLALPIVAGWGFSGRRRALAAAPVGLVALCALLFVYSRAGYLALFGSALALAGWAVHKRGRGRGWSRAAAVLLIAGLAGLSTIAFHSSRFMRVRFTAVRTDLGIRVDHWARAVEIRDTGLLREAFGTGLGTFPRKLRERAPGVWDTGGFRYETEAGNRFVRLEGGPAFYFGQRLRERGKPPYRLALKARADSPGAELRAAACRKSLLYSVDCVEHRFGLSEARGVWREMEGRLDRLPPGGGLGPVAGGTLELAFYNPVSGSLADIDDVHLVDSTGEDLLDNGDFSQGGDRWFFQSDRQILWHIYNLYVALLFEQGWFGLLAFGALVAAALRAAWVAARLGSAEAAGLGAGLVGFLVVGLFDSPLDAPRVATLFFLSMFVALSQESARS